MRMLWTYIPLTAALASWWIAASLSGTCELKPTRRRFIPAVAFAIGLYAAHRGLDVWALHTPLPSYDSAAMSVGLIISLGAALGAVRLADRDVFLTGRSGAKDDAIAVLCVTPWSALYQDGMVHSQGVTMYVVVVGVSWFVKGYVYRWLARMGRRFDRKSARPD